MAEEQPNKKCTRISGKAFALFKAECRRWQEKLGLTDWRIDFVFEPLPKDFADIECNLDGRVALCRLSSEVPACDLPFFDAARLAKHEVLHLATFRLYWLGAARHVLSSELEEEWESLVRRLEAIL